MGRWSLWLNNQIAEAFTEPGLIQGLLIHLTAGISFPGSKKLLRIHSFMKATLAGKWSTAQYLKQGPARPLELLWGSGMKGASGT